jgi:hypothetical protein
VGNLTVTSYRAEERIKVDVIWRGVLSNETQTKIFGGEGSAKTVLELT